MSSLPHVTPSQRHAMLQSVSLGLGWFSIGLGVVELLRPRATARVTGLAGNERLLQAYGAREIAAGVGLLASNDPAPWLWARVAGDMLDIATLGRGVTRGQGVRAGASLAAVIGVTLVDALCARAAAREAARKARPVFDYSDRSGFPKGVKAPRLTHGQASNGQAGQAQPADAQAGNKSTAVHAAGEVVRSSA